MIICNLHNFQLSIAHFLTDFLVLFLSDRSKIFRGKNLCSHHQTDSNETENPSKDALDKTKYYSKVRIMEIVTRL